MDRNVWNRRTFVLLGLLAAAGLAAFLWIPWRGGGEPQLFVGQHGFAFQLSAATARERRLTTGFRDADKRQEVVLIHPIDMAPEAAMTIPESQYGAKNLIRLEVNRNDSYPAKAQDRLLEAFEYAARETLTEKGETFTIKALEGSELPGFAVEIGTGPTLTQIFMKSATLHYLVTGRGDDPVLHEMLSSLADPDRLRPAVNEALKQ